MPSLLEVPDSTNFVLDSFIPHPTLKCFTEEIYIIDVKDTRQRSIPNLILS